MRVGAIVQARMGSTRLPGKVMLDLAEKPVLQRVLERTSAIRGLDTVIMATDHDTELYCAAESWGYRSFRADSSDESDVVSRYHSCADMYELDIIVRITADCPLLDPVLGSRVVANFMKGGFDYYSNVHPPTYPDGMDIEVFTFTALCKARTHAKGREREHVTPYIWKRPHKFRIGNLMSPLNLRSYRMTLDTAEDYEYISSIYDHFGDKPFGMADILALPIDHKRLDRKPVIV